ncbi:MAG: RNA polymerase factor sigma-54, partial [Sphaerochaetaceae bacterium]
NPTLGLQQALKQQLTLSPQLIQTFEILAMNNIELQQKIKAEVEQNPALEIPSERTFSIERLSDREGRKTVEDDYSDSTPYVPSYRATIRESTYFDQEAADRNQQFLEGVLTKGETLQEHLMRQLGWLRLSAKEREVGTLLISNLDKHGFHRNPPTEIIKEGEEELLERVLPLIQNMDPTGVATEDYRESLVVQAKADQLGQEDLDLFIRMVYDYLEQLRLKKIGEVAKELCVKEEQVELLYSYLKTLNPYPGLLYSDRETQYVIPDLFIRRIGGELQLRLNRENIPTLSIDSHFSTLEGDPRDKEYKKTSSYINRQIREAKQLITQIELRFSTIEKLGLELFAAQSEFFLKGPRYLKPLTYRDIAEKLSLHETTISRAVQGKYVDTDWGIIPLKELFSSALPKDKGEISKRAVMEIVQEIIESHTGDKPLSDQKITNILNERGIKIARRTVAKYRNELNIDPSFIRGS